MLAQRRLKWRLIIGFFLIISIVAAKSDKKSFKNNQQKLAHQRLDEIQGSGQPPKSNQASVDDEITAPGSGKNPSPGASVDDEDSVPVIEGSGQPPKDIVKPSATSTNRPLTTTSTEPNELKIEDQEEDDLDEDDESDDETVDLEPVFKQAEPETTTLPIKTSTSTAATPKQVFELMTRQPPTTTNAPTFPSQIDSVNLDMLRPGLLAAISGGAVVGLLLTILLVMFIVYRMRKKDEGSYSLDEQTNHHQPAHYSYAYQKAPTKEFYA